MVWIVWLVVVHLMALALMPLFCGFVMRGNVIARQEDEVWQMSCLRQQDGGEIRRTKAMLLESQIKIKNLEERIQDSDECWAKGFAKMG